jgi:tRNA(Ile)-lysidine synthetase-like protein
MANVGRRCGIVNFEMSNRQAKGVELEFLKQAIGAVPAGKWCVAVSGGADSVALYRLLRERSDIQLHLAHLNHQTRGVESDGDATFVKTLGDQTAVSSTIGLISEIVPTLTGRFPNDSARYRAARYELFRHVVTNNKLDGVILAHHRDDQAETVLHRLSRGAPPDGLVGMAPRTVVRSLVILRPLLEVGTEHLRAYLNSIGQTWREDASNASDAYTRNRLRRWLAERPEASAALTTLARTCRELHAWAEEKSVTLPETFPGQQMTGMPRVLARQSAKRWLIQRGGKPGELSEFVVERLVQMASDAATASRSNFPGGLQVRRRRGVISVKPKNERD